MKLVAKVYRYHGPPQDNGLSENFLLRKRKTRAASPAYLIAADETSITDANGTRNIESFQDMPDQPFVTLTKRESDNIALANPGVRPPAVLEDDYPWLPRRSYVPNSALGYQALIQIYGLYGTHFVSAVAYCNEKWNTICNAIRRKNSLDTRFYFAWHMPIQDVFLLEERRADRCVVALDVNAMYSACMQHKFPKPSALRCVTLDREHLKGERLAVGLYRCRLSKPATNFIVQHNPFRTFFCGMRLQAPLSETVEVDLNEFEIDYYAHHFDHIHLIDAVVSDEVISHPLAKEAQRAFARRLSYRRHGNKPLADREKFLATLQSSCASRPKRRKRDFCDRVEAMAYLESEYGISPPPDEPDVATDIWMTRGKGVNISGGPSGTKLDAPDVGDDWSCFMLGQRIVARGRVHLLELMERVLTIGADIDICYVNIDSIHLSVSKDQIAAVMANLAAEASDAMGSFKIEAVTAHGLWLEPGRYWLYSNHVEKFKNRSIGDGVHPFKDSAFHITSRRVGDLNIPIRVVLRMDKSMSDVRALDFESESHVSIVRQRLIERHETTTYSNTLDMLAANRSCSTPRRLEAFTRLKKSLEVSCPAASGQD